MHPDEIHIKPASIWYVRMLTVEAKTSEKEEEFGNGTTAVEIISCHFGLIRLKALACLRWWR